MPVDLLQRDLAEVSSRFCVRGTSSAVERKMNGCGQHDLIGFIANRNPHALANILVRVVKCYLAKCG